MTRLSAALAIVAGAATLLLCQAVPAALPVLCLLFAGMSALVALGALAARPISPPTPAPAERARAVVDIDHGRADPRFEQWLRAGTDQTVH